MPEKDNAKRPTPVGVQRMVVLLPMDDDEPDFTADEVDDMWESAGDDLDYEAAMAGEGCAFPGECCMPGPHYRHECHTAAMIEDRHNINHQP